MSLKQIILILLFSLFLLFVILKLVKSKKMSVKYSVIWFIPILVLLITIIFPSFVRYITKLIGFSVISNMIFVILITLLIFVTISLTIIVTTLKDRVRLLTQEISLLKSKIEEKEK